MLNVSCWRINPEDVYEFLERKIGPLKMVINNGKVMIEFEQQQHNQKALQDYKQVSIGQSSFRISQSQSHQTPCSEASLISPQIAAQLGVYEKLYSDALSNFINDSKKGLLSFCNRLGIKLTEINQSDQTPSQAEARKGQLHKRMFELLLKIDKKINDNMEILHEQAIAFQAKSLEIDLDMDWKLAGLGSYTTQSVSEPQFIPGLRYQTELAKPAKRLLHLTQNYYAASFNDGKDGCINFYHKDQQAPHSSLPDKLPFYAMGLLSNQWLMAAHDHGNVSVYNMHYPNEPKQIFNLHQTQIFQINTLCNLSRGPVVLTTGTDSKIKGWNANLIEIFPQFFEVQLMDLVTHNVGDERKLTASTQVNDEILVYATEQSVRELNWACNNVVRSFHGKGFSRLQRIEEQVVLIGETNGLTLMDLRCQSLIKSLNSPNISIKSLRHLSNSLVFFGRDEGTTGVFDLRHTSEPVWMKKRHNDRITDIIKLDTSVVVADNKGTVKRWLNGKC